MGGDGYAAAPRPWKKPNYRRYKRCSQFLLGTVLDTSERRVILARRKRKLILKAGIKGSMTGTKRADEGKNRYHLHVREAPRFWSNLFLWWLKLKTHPFQK